MKTRSILMITLMLALLSASAHSTPFRIDDTAGKPGDTVELTLNDGNTQDFEAVTLLVTYDVSRLEFLNRKCPPRCCCAVDAVRCLAAADRLASDQ